TQQRALYVRLREHGREVPRRRPQVHDIAAAGSAHRRGDRLSVGDGLETVPCNQTPQSDTSLVALSAGTRLGSYEIVSLLGRGGMGEVYLAEDTRLGRRVAIKLLPAESMTDERAKALLLREARAAARLDHPNICAIYEVGEVRGLAFIVMQFVEGETLAERMGRKPL